jgi:hypothetical protein
MSQEQRNAAKKQLFRSFILAPVKNSIIYQYKYNMCGAVELTRSLKLVLKFRSFFNYFNVKIFMSIIDIIKNYEIIFEPNSFHTILERYE